MRRFLFLLIFLQISLMFGSQFEIVSEIEENPMHMGLMSLDDAYRYDNRGELGALIIVDCGLKDVFFKNMASKIYQTDKSGSYWVVLKQKAQYFVISKDGYANYKYDFPSPLKSGTVYRMTIDEKNKLPDETTLIITSNQNNAQVYVDGKKIGTTENKVFSGNVALGSHQIELRKSGFQTKEVSHNITMEDSRMEISLDPAIPTAVTITTEPEGASVYIDNVLFGTSPKSSFFAEGTYSIKIEKESYGTIAENITITEPETKKHYKLKDLRATLTINTSNLATIKLNGKVYPSVKNMKLPSSVVEIEVSQSKAKTIKQYVTLKQEENKTLDIYPEIEQATIIVVTIPTSASIELTGDAGEYYTAIGRKSFTDIPIGTYELVIANDGYKTHKETIKLTADNTEQKQISLEEGSDIPDTFVFVQGGTFQMGSNDGEDDEKPVHSVTLSDFMIGKYEVTQAEWQEVMGTNPSEFKGDKNPVEEVSWYDAVEFCNKKSRKEGLEEVYSGSGPNIKCDFSKNGYRLPTEAEWEYVARGGNKSKDYKYSGSYNIGEVAWFSDNSGSKTHAVGGKKANELGLYDMSGNVWEWCWDWKESYSSSSQSNPVGPTSGSNRVIRGDSWSGSATYCRVTNRYYNSPTYSSSVVGFRLARSSN